MINIRYIGCADIIVLASLSSMAFDKGWIKGKCRTLNTLSGLISGYRGSVDDVMQYDDFLQAWIACVMEHSFCESLAGRLYDSHLKSSVQKAFSQSLCAGDECINDISLFPIKSIKSNATPRWYNTNIRSNKHILDVCSIINPSVITKMYTRISSVLTSVKGDRGKQLNDDTRFTLTSIPAKGAVGLCMHNVSCPGIMFFIFCSEDRLFDYIYDEHNDEVSITYMGLLACNDMYLPLCFPPRDIHNHNYQDARVLNVSVIHIRISDFKQTILRYTKTPTRHKTNRLSLSPDDIPCYFLNKVSVYIDNRQYDLPEHHKREEE